MKKKILIIVSHPDDEILGCGGSIAKFINEGHNVKVYFTHEGSSARYKTLNNIDIEKQILSRQKMALKASKYLNYQIIEFGKNINLDNRNYNALYNVKKIIKIFGDYKPDIVYTHHPDDLNEDHRYTSKTVITACRPNSKFNICDIYFMEIPSSTEWSLKNSFKPNVFLSIDKFYKKKIKALNFYKDEMRKAPHPRSKKNIEALSIFRGSQVGLVKAEAFELCRIIKY